MIKKILAITLSIAMLMSVPAFAAVDTTSRPGYTIYTDNFDHRGTGTVNGSSTPYTSDVFEPSNKISGGAVGHGYASISAGKGPDSSQALFFNTRSDSRFIVTKALDTAKVNEFSYDIKFSSNEYALKLGNNASAAGNSGVLFDLQAGGGIKTYSGSTGTINPAMTYSADKWYHIRIVSYGGKKHGWMYDDQGNSIYSMVNATPTRLSPFFMVGATSGKITLTLDNAEIVEYAPADVAPTVVTGPAIAGQEIEADTASTTVTFDQLLDTTSTATLKLRGDDEGVPCAITMDTSAPYKYTIALPELEGGTDYTLDLSTLTNTGAAAVAGTASYDFSTKAAPIKVTSSTPADGAEDVAITTKTMSVTFSGAPVNPAPTVSITGGTIPITATATVDADDPLTYTFDWSDYEDDLLGLTTYTVDLSGFSNAAGPATPSSISFTTASDGIIKITDGFENVTDVAGYNTLNSNGVPRNSSIPLTTGAGNASGYVSSVTGYGDIGKAIRLSTGSSGSCIDSVYLFDKITPDVKNGELEKLVVTYRFNYEDFAENGTAAKWNSSATEGVSKGTQIRFSAGSSKSADAVARIISYNEAEKCYFNSIGNEKAYPDAAVIQNHWYNIVWIIDGTTQTFIVIDAEGENKGDVVFKNVKTFTYNPNNGLTVVPLSVGRLRDGNNVWNEKHAVKADDFTIWRIKPWKASQTLKEEAGKVVDSGSAFGGGCEFTFDQPVILDKTMFEINDGAVESNPTFTYPDFTKATVKFTDLAANGDYTVDYSEIKSAGGTDLGDAKNTAVFDIVTGAYSDEITAGAITVTSYDADGVVNATLTSKSAVNADVVAVFYNSTNPDEISAIRLAKKSLAKGANDVAINLNSAVSADSVKLYVLVLDKLIPLMK